MTYLEIVSALGAAGALASATATFLTVREIAKQRETTYRPELIVPAQLVEIDLTEDAARFGQWHSEESKKARIAQIPLLNIGLGAAKQITAEWTCPIAEITSQIQSLRTGSNVKIAVGKRMISIEHPVLSNRSVALPSAQSIDAVLPAARADTPITLRLPIAYTALSSILLREGFESESIEEPPPLELRLTYLDIANRKHSASYRLRFDFHVGRRDRVDAQLVPDKVLPERKKRSALSKLRKTRS